MKKNEEELDSISSCNLAECFEIWNDMRGQFPTQFQSHLTKRADLAVQDCMLAANVLDHRFGGKNLMPIELTRAKAFIKKELTQYLAKEPMELNVLKW